MDVKEVIRRHGYTVPEVSEMLGLSRPSLNATLRYGRPTAGTLHKIAAVIGADYAEFFQDEALEQQQMNSDTRMSRALHQVMMQHVLSPDVVAAKMNMSREELGAFMADGRQTKPRLRRLAKAFGMELEELEYEIETYKDELPPRDAPQLTKNIMRCLRERGLTVADVARRMGQDRRDLWKTLHGRPSVRTLRRVAEAAEVDYAEFYNNKTSNSKYNQMDVIGVIKEKGFTLAQVADRITTKSGKPMHPTALSISLRNGNPTVKTLTQIADAIGCRVRDFFPE
ncbi:MAG: helix-turn-helix transcriptional regulator [Bacteroidaceae bacterium]|nr:helix-turn-helix transcriptional regulator [Bacteroidaceae bacterium]